MTSQAAVVTESPDSGEAPPPVPQSGVAAGSSLERWIAPLGKISLLVVLGWAGGRGYEIATGQALFLPLVVKAVVLGGMGLFALFLALRLVGAAGVLRRSAPWQLVATWLAVGAYCLGLAWFQNSFRIAAVGLAASLGGLEQSAGQAVYLLCKFSPASPVLPLAAVVGGCLGADIPWHAMTPFIFGPSVVGAYAWVSLGLAVLFICLPTGRGFMKLLHLLGAMAAVVLFTGLLSSLVSVLPSGQFTRELMVLARDLPSRQPSLEGYMTLHLALVMAVVLQALLVVAMLRSWALRKAGEVSLAAKPPGAVRLFFLTYLVLPIVADMFNRLTLV